MLANELRQKLSQSMIISPQMRQGLKLLAMSLPELRAELFKELGENPVIDDVESILERTTVSDKERELKERDNREEDDYPKEDYDPESEYVSESVHDTEALERRQRFFDSQTKEESLEEHLLAQLEMSDIDPKDIPLAEMLIGELNEDGYFVGSIPDLMMVSGENEKHIRRVLSQLTELDPAGCGATCVKECLLAQIEDLDDDPYQDDVRALVERHLEDVAANRLDVIMKDLDLTREQYVAALKVLRSLNPRPGRAFRKGGRGPEYVNPEVHVVKTTEGWRARVDARSLPTIRISPKYEKLLEDPHTDKETKAYIRERMLSARSIVEAVEHRQETITSIAQAIFDAQPGFFENGLKGLRPLTMQEIAEKVGVNHTTVSRTVRDKYASTPKGTVELRRFFTSGVATDSGEVVAKDNVLDILKGIVDGEDKAHPLSDDRISALLKAKGLVVARRTVAKYRGQLGIPGTSERRA